MRGPAAAASRIPVERIGCPLMLIVGSDDQAWSAAYACDDIAKTLRANGWPHELAYLEYNGAGHVFPPTNTVMTMSRWSFHSHLKALHVMGGTPEVNAHASRHAWRSALEFFRKHLAANEA
jgi:dienelactone hydrolase